MVSNWLAPKQYIKKNRTGIIHHRNYILKNMKQLNLPDIMDVIIGDFSVSELYRSILDDSKLQDEIEREIKPYFYCLEYAAKEQDKNLFDNLIHELLPAKAAYVPIHINLSLKLLGKGYAKWAESILLRSKKIKNLPEEISNHLDKAISTIPDN